MNKPNYIREWENNRLAINQGKHKILKGGSEVFEISKNLVVIRK